MLASFRMPCTSYCSVRPPQGKAVSHRRSSVPRAGSPAYWAPRLDVPPSGPEFHTGNAPLPASPLMNSNTTLGDNFSPCAPCQGPCAMREHLSLSLPPHAPMYMRGRTPWASRTCALATHGHTLALSSSHQRSRCRQCFAMVCTPSLENRQWRTKRHLDDDLRPPHLPRGPEVTPQGGTG